MHSCICTTSRSSSGLEFSCCFYDRKRIFCALCFGFKRRNGCCAEILLCTKHFVLSIIKLLCTLKVYPFFSFFLSLLFVLFCFSVLYLSSFLLLLSFLLLCLSFVLGPGAGGGGAVTLFRPLQTHAYRVCLLVGCLTSQQHASVSQGRICTDNFTCCHTEIEAADRTFHLTQSQYTDTGPTSPSADPITPGAWQGGHWSANV